MNYIDYINEVVSPQQKKTKKFKLSKGIKKPTLNINPDNVKIIKDRFWTKRDLIISYEFDRQLNTPPFFRIDIGFDFRGMCIDVGPLREWDYSFWE